MATQVHKDLFAMYPGADPSLLEDLMQGSKNMSDVLRKATEVLGPPSSLNEKCGPGAALHSCSPSTNEERYIASIFPNVPLDVLRHNLKKYHNDVNATIGALCDDEGPPPKPTAATGGKAAPSTPSSTAPTLIDEFSNAFPAIPLEVIRDAIEGADGNYEIIMEHLLRISEDSGDEAVVDSPSAEDRNGNDNRIDRYCTQFTTLDARTIRKVTNRVKRNVEECNVDSEIFKELTARSSRKQWASDAAKPNAKPQPSYSETIQAPPSVDLPPPPVAKRVRSSNDISEAATHHFHLFWDYDNIHEHSIFKDPVEFLQKVKNYFATKAMPQRRVSAVHVETFLVPSSHITMFQINGLRDTGAKIVQCSPKPGDADRQIYKSVMDLLSWGLDADNHSIVIVSSDKDFTLCAENIRRQQFVAWCVHDARHDSPHERILSGMYSKCLAISDIMHR